MTHILVVDDDAAIRQSLCWLLEDEGYAVEQAPDGQPALLRLRQHPEGLVVLLDLNMPGVDGIQVLQTVAAEGPLAQRHAFVVMTAGTASLSPQVTELLRRLRIPVIAKPFDLEQMVVAVALAAQRLAAGAA